VVGGSIGPVLASVIMAGFLVSYQPPFGPPIELTGEQGYIWAWMAGLAFSIVGFLVAMVMRPGKGLDYDNEVEHHGEHKDEAAE